MYSPRLSGDINTVLSPSPSTRRRALHESKRVTLQKKNEIQDVECLIRFSRHYPSSPPPPRMSCKNTTISWKRNIYPFSSHRIALWLRISIRYPKKSCEIHSTWGPRPFVVNPAAAATLISLSLFACFSHGSWAATPVAKASSLVTECGRNTRRSQDKSAHSFVPQWQIPSNYFTAKD